MDFPALFMTFLSDNWVFFQEGEITWNGKRHAINGLQVNASKVDDFKPFISENVHFNNIKEALDYFIAFLTNIEKDEEFVVPRSAIASGIAKGLPEGDLTPITFANLAACGSALMVREVGENDYAVLFDRRLAQGIPCFFNLSARLIWDFRQLTRSGRGVPFKVGFLRGRSIDADACFDESVDVVPGAQDDILVMDVDSAPAISLDSKQEGLRLDTLKACLNTLDPERFAEIEGSPSDIAIGNPTERMMEDSELFQALLLQEARAMPRCYAIEGTGYKGRAERVEAMKPGDPVILESDWQCDYFDPVGIEVFNTENQTLGYLSLDLSEETPVVGGFRQLACMLPYVVATVDSVTPVSARGRGAKYPLMDIRVELIGEALDRSVEPVQLTAEALDACKTMFSLPSEASGASSILLSDDEFEEPAESGEERDASLSSDAVALIGEGADDACSSSEDDCSVEAEADGVEAVSSFEESIIRNIPNLLEDCLIAHDRYFKMGYAASPADLDRYYSNKGVSAPKPGESLLLVLDVASLKKSKMLIKAIDLHGKELGCLSYSTWMGCSAEEANRKLRLLACLLPYVVARLSVSRAALIRKEGIWNVELDFVDSAFEDKSRKRLAKEALETCSCINQGLEAKVRSTFSIELPRPLRLSDVYVSISGDARSAMGVLSAWKNESCPIDASLYSKTIKGISAYLADKEKASIEPIELLIKKFVRFGWSDKEANRAIEEISKNFDVTYCDLLGICLAIVNQPADTGIEGSNFRLMLMSTSEILRDIEARFGDLSRKHPFIDESILEEKVDAARGLLRSMVDLCNQKLRAEFEVKCCDLANTKNGLERQAGDLQSQIGKRGISLSKKKKVQEREQVLARIDELNARLEEIDQEYKSLMLSKDDFEGKE